MGQWYKNVIQSWRSAYSGLVDYFQNHRIQCISNDRWYASGWRVSGSNLRPRSLRDRKKKCIEPYGSSYFHFIESIIYTSWLLSVLLVEFFFNFTLVVIFAVLFRMFFIITIWFTFGGFILVLEETFFEISFTRFDFVRLTTLKIVS